MDLFTVRDGRKLVPATQLDLERLEKVRSKQPLHTSVFFKRSTQHNRWYRGLVSVVAEGIGADAETLHQEIKFRAGLIERIITINSENGPRPVACLRSTAFASMEEGDFKAYTEVAIEIIFRDYLPGVARKHVFDRVAEMVGPRPR
jgi:hypothetical protein